jgi:hypothetical protein
MAPAKCRQGVGIGEQGEHGGVSAGGDGATIGEGDGHLSKQSSTYHCEDAQYLTSPRQVAQVTLLRNQQTAIKSALSRIYYKILGSTTSSGAKSKVFA